MLIIIISILGALIVPIALWHLSRIKRRLDCLYQIEACPQDINFIELGMFAYDRILQKQLRDFIQYSKYKYMGQAAMLTLTDDGKKILEDGSQVIKAEINRLKFEQYKFWKIYFY